MPLRLVALMGSLWVASILQTGISEARCGAPGNELVSKTLSCIHDVLQEVARVFKTSAHLGISLFSSSGSFGSVPCFIAMTRHT